MISIDGLAVEFGGTTLFSDISFVINEKDRIALMGKNGAGKSTLLKILAGVRQPTRGKISAPKDCVIAYLPQHLMTEDGRTVFQETAQAFAHLHEMEAEIDRMNKELETRTDYESDSYMELIEQVSALSEKFYAIDATNYEEDVEKALLGLGFTREDIRPPDKRLQRWLAHAHRTCQTAAAETGCAFAGRAHQSSGHRVHPMVGRLPHQ